MDEPQGSLTFGQRHLPDPRVGAKGDPLQDGRVILSNKRPVGGSENPLWAAIPKTFPLTPKRESRIRKPVEESIYLHLTNSTLVPPLDTAGCGRYKEYPRLPITQAARWLIANMNRRHEE